MALYMLSEVKNFRYVSKNENSRETAFDIAVTSFMIIITIIMSIPKVFRIITFPFVTVFQFVYGWIVKGILAVTYPIARLLNYFYSLIPELDQDGIMKPGFDNMLGMPDKYDEAMKSLHSPLVQLIGKALAFIIMLIICAYAIYLLFKFINRITRTEEEDDFVENKEFILRSGKKKALGIMSKLAGSMKRAAGNLSFMFTADNGDKLRNEYRIFIQKLYSKKVIEDNNCTAQDVLQRMLIQIPNQRNALISITETYEEVRYGVKSPGDDELKSFRKNITEITKNLQEMQ
jgi:large-conductance mechanosensitive channel